MPGLGSPATTRAPDGPNGPAPGGNHAVGSSTSSLEDPSSDEEPALGESPFAPVDELLVPVALVPVALAPLELTGW